MSTKIISTLQKLLPIGALLTSFFWLAPAHADPQCVSNDGELQTQLSLATFPSGVTNTIHLVQRSGANFYTLPITNLIFPQPIVLEGGYTAGCVSRTVNAANTVVDMGGHGFSLEQDTANPTALIKLEGFTLRNGAALTLTSGLYGSFSDNAGAVRLSHMRITGFSVPNVGDPQFLDYPVKIISHAADVSLDDVQFDHISQPSIIINPCAVLISMDEDSQAALHYVTADLSNSNKLCFSVDKSSGNYAAQIYNSIIWSSDGSSVGIATLDPTNSSNSFNLKLVNSLYRNNVTGVAAVSATNSLFTDPQWSLPGSGNYHLAFNSPAVNSGTLLVPGGSPATDIEGVSRIVGSAPDRGASESTFTDLASFIVTNNSDCSATNCHSLRDAITQSNSNGNASTITFNIPNTVGSPCPHVIGLGSKLPDITSPITIDGYSQPSSAMNSDNDAFFATLCVIVKPASGTLSSGFNVPLAAPSGASLTLRGIGMGGFDNTVVLMNGNNHLIAGNQFGGNVGSVVLPEGNGVEIGGNANGNLIIGGSDIADRNDFDGQNTVGHTAISIESGINSTPDKCQIVNNIIGLKSNAATVGKYTFGINLVGSGCSVVANRVGGNFNGILINGGSNNVVQRNLIGIGAGGIDVENTNSLVVSSGNNNAIGTLANGGVFGGYLGNQIRYVGGSGTSGVHVAAGTGNFVRSNQMQRTGLFSGDGVDIDLGTAGPTLNDNGDGDSGANNMQNFPLVRGLLFSTAPAAGATNVAASISATLNGQSGNNIRIDAYFSDSCTSAGRGSAQQYLGTVTTGIGISASDASFTLGVTLPNMQAGSNVSLTATDAGGNTSEIGTCFPVDRIFKDSMEVQTGN
ncbi:hypothetical protein ELE36_17160 [Pseudolysobacter antarcticus]|uniref:Right-handed parallel beta-helix repeat-containing protein n=1 Tax=Pseudolysobacter antarcticus TaxID=2511995 RepID=A0A411HNA1_9GAMM|nr:choice-of-anchor Q domain-containing protein [Pseudolysobacter antarcticus]QBB71950.1 hypothetical protein ELE36_17160 [Pseudolysobacter antarcticus]